VRGLYDKEGGPWGSLWCGEAEEGAIKGLRREFLLFPCLVEGPGAQCTYPTSTARSGKNDEEKEERGGESNQTSLKISKTRSRRKNIERRRRERCARKKGGGRPLS